MLNHYLVLALHFVPYLLFAVIPAGLAWLGSEAVASGMRILSMRHNHNWVFCVVGGFCMAGVFGLGLGAAAAYAAYIYYDSHWFVILPVAVWLWYVFKEPAAATFSEVGYQRKSRHIG